jgi:hypothetical protein
MPESLFKQGRYYWQFCKISQDFLRSQLQTSKERRGIRPCFAKLQILKPIWHERETLRRPEAAPAA